MNEDRLTELEMRYTLQQELLQQLSDVVHQHEREIDRLRREVEQLRGRVADGGVPLDPDEKPPHY